MELKMTHHTSSDELDYISIWNKIQELFQVLSINDIQVYSLKDKKLSIWIDEEIESPIVYVNHVDCDGEEMYELGKVARDLEKDKVVSQVKDEFDIFEDQDTNGDDNLIEEMVADDQSFFGENK